jgi:hypothetical protein
LNVLTWQKNGMDVCLFDFSVKRAAIVGQGWYNVLFEAEMGVDELEVSGFVAVTKKTEKATRFFFF